MKSSHSKQRLELGGMPQRSSSVNQDQMKSNTQPLPRVSFSKRSLQDLWPWTFLQGSMPFTSVSIASLASSLPLPVSLHPGNGSFLLRQEQRAWLQKGYVCSCARSPSLILWKHHLRAAQRPLTSKGLLLRSPNLISITLSTVPLDMPSGGTLTWKPV